MHDAAVAERIADRIETFEGRVHDALAFAAIMRSGEVANARTPAAYVLPLGFRGGQVASATGIYVQHFEEIVGVVLALRQAGATKGEALKAAIAPLADDVIAAVVGWTPDGALGPFRAAKGELLNFASGLALYQIDFAIDSQFRLTLQED